MKPYRENKKIAIRENTYFEFFWLLGKLRFSGLIVYKNFHNPRSRDAEKSIPWEALYWARTDWPMREPGE